MAVHEHENNEKDPSKVYSNEFAVNYMAMSPVIVSSILRQLQYFIRPLSPIIPDAMIG